MIAYCIPTRDRPAHLARTLAAIGSLAGHERVGGAEVIVVDNASRKSVDAPCRLVNGLPVTVLRLDTNEGAAARNAGVRAADARAEWIVMLDDDSHPMDAGFLGALMRAGSDVAAVTADIRTPAGAREMGGLPEVPVGCAVAYRRCAYEQVGGYDPSFGYYAEEYDLAAKLLLGGWRVQYDPWFRVMHERANEQRDMNSIVSLLVRNNGWVVQRYTPDAHRDTAMERVITRLRVIAHKESAMEGFTRGMAMLQGAPAQKRTPMSPMLYDRFTGLAHACEALAAAHTLHPLEHVALVDEGKHAWVVRQALAELGVEVEQARAPLGRTRNPQLGELCHHTCIIGTMSPGPMADALDRRSGTPGIRIIAPWLGIHGSPGPDAVRALTGDAPQPLGTRPEHHIFATERHAA